MSPQQQLKELLPQYNDDQIKFALAQCGPGAVDAAVELLLQQEPATAAAVGHRIQAKMPMNSQLQAHNTSDRPSWAAMRSPHQNNSSATSSKSTPNSPGLNGLAAAAPVYVRSRGLSRPPPPTLSHDAFPALAETPAAGPHAQHAHDGVQQQEHQSRNNGSMQRPISMYSNAQRRHNQQPQSSTVRRSRSATSFAEVAKQYDTAQQHQRQQHQQLLPRPPPQQSGTFSVSSATVLQPRMQTGNCTGQQAQQVLQQNVQDITEQLAQLHPWCDKQLLHEVLATVHGDVAAAAAALVDLAPAGPDDKPSNSSNASSDSECSSRPNSPTETCRVMSSTPVQEGDSHAIQPTKHAQHKQQLVQQQSVADGKKEDVYHEMRGEALRLTRQWQKTLRRSAAAAAVGDYSTAKKLSNEARALKAAADEAHATAALKIEVLHNMNSSAGLWEIDLHGLHVGEALQALQERLELLQALVQDLTAQQQATKADSTVTLSADNVSAAARHGVRSRQQVLTQLLFSDDQPLHVQQAALSQQLRVIVGRGNHSSGGEASLPRVVERWLADAQYKYVLRSGAIDVKLKRFHQLPES